MANTPDDTAKNLPALPGYRDVIIRAANDPSFDIDKLERLVELQEALETRAADREFNVAMSRAQGEMEAVRAESYNPQTRSRYAKYAVLDRAIRPIYTKYGFSISYNTEPSGDVNLLRVIGLAANGAITHRHQVDMPIVTTGFKGTDMMTKTHATSSALTYGKRALLGMIFNIPVDTDDDGNRAGGRPPQQQRQPTVRPAEAPVHPETGEVSPHTIAFLDAEDGTPETWQAFGARFIQAINSATTEPEVNAWITHNRTTLDQFQKDAPNVFVRLEAAIDKHRNEIRSKGATKEEHQHGGS